MAAADGKVEEAVAVEVGQVSNLYIYGKNG